MALFFVSIKKVDVNCSDRCILRYISVLYSLSINLFVNTYLYVLIISEEKTRRSYCTQGSVEYVLVYHRMSKGKIKVV